MNTEKIVKKNLVLSRCEGEKIIIGEDVTVEIVKVTTKGLGKHQVRLMISAPKEIEVDREEVRERKDIIRANYGQY